MAKKKSDLQSLLTDTDGIKGVLREESEIPKKEEVEVRASQGLKNEEANSMVNENEYIQSPDLYLPFSTAMRADLYLKLKRIEYWNRTTIKRELERLIEDFVDTQTASKKPLPVEERNKLKQLKTAKDYIKLRLKK
ncbi:hypothetical protein [Pontibacter harenae]|uniref:hypothetical protein n=1 Tax=Pontibacter harenae TaxID=2894083 RepID=UPI001E6357A1|nr:hypothetical protein [Pontibacter harenae]MCC9167895.1 hypothetical protein [Pontibacter harenae]